VCGWLAGKRKLLHPLVVPQRRTTRRWQRALMPLPARSPELCPNCGTSYKVVGVEVGPESFELTCGAPFSAMEGAVRPHIFASKRSALRNRAAWPLSVKRWGQPQRTPGGLPWAVAVAFRPGAGAVPHGGGFSTRTRSPGTP
jgi:hypothetical protein